MLIDDIKTALRISHDRLDDEIGQHISACCEDMKRLGVNVPDDSEALSPLLKTAVELYCKWQYDYTGKGESFQKGYESLRDGLSLSSGYREGGGDV